ncbi:Uncharacterized nucleotidyltransferase [Tenacibaculum sp. 190524A02b]|uniref:nucleotidyltransferase family protein n=1 Tax=Tenacibaculum vairaonense TaxID=3137860 RepID=UPI0032B154A0
MNYKETLFFVAKCLTISHEEENKKLVEEKIVSGSVNWDNVVKLSTSHFVFPALYCNLKRADFLQYLPNDLVEYMQHITQLNRERNEQIIEQAKEINQLLLDNGITPIFLKGTGNLLEGLYEDIAERMVGDIDFIIHKSDYLQTIKLLKSKNYSYVANLKYNFPSFKHYPRIQNEQKIAAVEIHKQITIEKYANEFNFDFVVKDKQVINGVNVLSYQHQLCLSIIAKQINDDGIYFKDISLRNAYDVFLLSKKTSAKNSFDKLNKLKKPLNSFLASCHFVFGEIESLDYKDCKDTQSYLSFFKRLLNDSQLQKKHFSKQKKYIYLKSRLNIIYKSIFDKDHRFWLIKRLTDNELKKQLKNLN